GGQHDVVEVRAKTRNAPVEIAVEPLLERRDCQRLALVAQLCIRETQLARSFRKWRLEQRECLLTRRDELGPERRDLLGPRRKRVTRRETAGDAAKRRVPLCN